MLLRRTCCWVLLLSVIGLPTTSARAQLITGNDSVIGKLNPFRPSDPTRPATVAELCRWVDCLSEDLRDDGLVVLKQPDVFSQARLTRFRRQFDEQMSTDLGKFHLVLSARINRLDAATTTQTTTLGAALAAPGSANVTVPTPPTVPAFGTGASLDTAKTTFSSLGLDTNTPGSTLGLGVDPTVYLDEKKRFLEHLNQIRRISLGPDQNDSSGYGLYLVRLPVSITPGEKTYQGFGADLAVTVEHEFPPDFLPSTFRNLVINDLVDQLGPVIYEVIRSGMLDKFGEAIGIARSISVERSQLLEKKKGLIEHVLALFGERMSSFVTTQAATSNLDKPRGTVTSLTVREILTPIDNNYVDPLANYILRLSMSQTVNSEPEVSNAIADRLTALADASAKVKTGTSLDDLANTQLIAFRKTIARIRQGAPIEPAFQRLVKQRLQTVILSFIAGPGKTIEGPINPPLNPDKFNWEMFRPFLRSLYDSVLLDDVDILDDFMQTPLFEREQTTRSAARVNSALFAMASLQKKLEKTNLNLTSTRNPKQAYPLSPREILNFFLEENIYRLALDAKQALITKTPRSTDVRNYLRHTLSVAYDAMSRTNPRPGASVAPPLADVPFMDEILESVKERRYLPIGQTSPLTMLFERLVDHVEQSRDNVREKPIGALCWAIAVDAVLLDDAFHQDVLRVFATHGLPCDIVSGVRFYLPKEFPNDAARAIFNDYVRSRWPIITFALDPVTDQQNIADSFNLKRDLQLALSYAFATGQINFNQVNTFRRQIEQAADTIALNRTVTGFAHGNDIFGFRFTPRFQNPPNQKTNIGVIASQLISGGPGPNYQIKHSKLEAGMREVTAVLLLPTFLPTMRMQIATNWFRLHDPEHLVFHTSRMMEHGRRAQELRGIILDACNAARYRNADLRVLQAKLGQLDAMLPMQSTVIQLPYENTANGFDLFSDGATALVPELSGFEGVDVVQAGKAADIFVFGKYISLLDTKVIVGGKILPDTAVDILSREVVHVQLPADATPTTTSDDPAQTYLEVHLATPNGISNRVLVPFLPTAAVAPAATTAFDLNAKTRALTVKYQWSPSPKPSATLVASADPNTPDKQPIKITWQSPTAIAPKTLCAQFSATLPSGPTLSFMLEANSGNEDDYVVDTAQFVKCLIKQLSGSVAPPTLLPGTLAFDISVRPKDADNVRVLSGLAKLPSQLTVTFQYFSSRAPFYPTNDNDIDCNCGPKKPVTSPAGMNAAPDQPVPPPPPPAAQSNGPPPSAPQNHQTPALEPIPSEPPGMPQTFRRPMNDGRLTPVAFQQPMQPSGPVGTAASLFAANAGVAADPAPAFTQVVTTGDETASAAVAKFNALIKSAESELNLALAKPGSPAAATARFAGLTKTAQADLNSALAGLSSPAAMTAKFEAAVKAAEADRKGALASQASPALAAAKFASAVKAAQADLNAGLSGQDSPDAVAAKFAGEAKVAEANLVSALEAHNETVPKSPVIVAPAPVVIAGSNAAPVKKPKSRFHPSRIVGDVRKALGGNATSVLNR